MAYVFCSSLGLLAREDGNGDQVDNYIINLI